jgi:hypothetical protein
MPMIGIWAVALSLLVRASLIPELKLSVAEDSRIPFVGLAATVPVIVTLPNNAPGFTCPVKLQLKVPPAAGSAGVQVQVAGVTDVGVRSAGIVMVAVTVSDPPVFTTPVFVACTAKLVLLPMVAAGGTDW